MLDAQKVPRCAAARQIQGKRCWLLRFDRGQRIHARDTKGTAWRIVSGSVRLDREEPNGEQSFANLAIRGDVIGAETLLFGKYSFTATALTACVLESWPEGSASPVGDSLLRTLAKAERRTAEVIALRCGQAADRVRRLVMMLAHPAVEHPANTVVELQVVLPSRQDMADITALTLETVSRMVSQLRHAGVLDPLRHDGKRPSQRNFAIRHALGETH